MYIGELYEPTHSSIRECPFQLIRQQLRRYLALVNKAELVLDGKDPFVRCALELGRVGLPEVQEIIVQGECQPALLTSPESFEMGLRERRKYRNSA